MNEELLNTPLFKRLCEATDKWFHKDRGYEQKVGIFKYGNGQDFYFSKAVIGGVERNAEFSVHIFTDEHREDGHYRYHYGLSLYYLDDVAGKEGFGDRELEAGIRWQINRYNCDGSNRCITYHHYDRIFINQTFYFYPGCMPSEDEIFEILDNFYFDEANQDIAVLIESKGWWTMDLPLERYLKWLEQAKAKPKEMEDHFPPLEDVIISSASKCNQ